MSRNLSRHELDALAATVRRDIGQLDAGMILATLKATPHWGFICDEAIDEASVSGSVLRARDVEDGRRETEGKIEELTKELSAATDKVDELKAELAQAGDDFDRLQELIVSRQVSDALDLLRQMAPHHDFLSPSAEAMLAAQRSFI